jgi:hypothetical protein
MFRVAYTPNFNRAWFLPDEEAIIATYAAEHTNPLGL